MTNHVYARAVRALQCLGFNEQSLLYGPGHVVFSDGNYDQAQWCIDHFGDQKYDYAPVELAIVRWALEEIAKYEIRSDIAICDS